MFKIDTGPSVVAVGRDTTLVVDRLSKTPCEFAPSLAISLPHSVSRCRELRGLLASDGVGPSTLLHYGRAWLADWLAGFAELQSRIRLRVMRRRRRQSLLQLLRMGFPVSAFGSLGAERWCGGES